MQRDIQELRDLPLEALLSAVLNAAIAAQTNAALSTADFIKQIGFIDDSESLLSLFDDQGEAKSDVRTADLTFKKKVFVDGSIEEVEESISLPYISLFNIPALEIDSVDFDFKADLKSVESFETSFTHSTTATTTSDSEVGADLTSIGLPIKIGTRTKVEVKQQTDYELRYGAGREQQYSLRVQVKAGNAPQPRGIERLFDIAERISAENEAAAQAAADADTN